MYTDHYNILLTPSNNLFCQTLVVMMSAIEICEKKVNFYIMESDWSMELKRACSEWIKEYWPNTVTFLNVEEEEFHIFRPWRNIYQSNYLLFAHKYLPEEMDRILYLDTDTLVLKDIIEFYSMDFEDAFLIVAEEQCNKKYSDFKKNPQKQTYESAIFNSGVVLMNLYKFREENIDTNFYLKHIHDMGDVPYFADQGLLNYIFGGSGQIKLVPAYKYNHTVYQEIVFNRIFSYTKEERAKRFNENYTEDFDENHADSIIHFTYNPKPWTVIVRNGDIVEGQFKKMTSSKMYRELCVVTDVNPEENIMPYVKHFYVLWWEAARKLPLSFYEQILTEAFLVSVKKPLSDSLFAYRNAAGFAKSVAFDCFEKEKLKRYLEDCRDRKKKVAILKAKDIAGQILIKALKAYNIEIVLESQWPVFDRLSKEEIELCRKADIVISADVHSNALIAKYDLKAVRVKELLK